MFLSVVIPTFNRRDSLKLTLDGLARQDYPAAQFEVLVISDGSTDGTDDFVRSYAAQAPYRLSLLTQENAGPARARNRGIEAAQGTIIVFVDDDVEPCPCFLTAHAGHHQSHENTVVIGPLSPDPQMARREPPWIAWEHAMLQKQYVGWKTGFFTEVNPGNFYSGNGSVRRAQLLAVGGYDEAFTRQEDVELACRLERRFHPAFVFDPQADALHRPRRSYASWLAVPLAYGRLDVIRARRGDAAVGCGSRRVPCPQARDPNAGASDLGGAFSGCPLARSAVAGGPGGVPCGPCPHEFCRSERHLQPALSRRCGI